MKKKSLKIVVFLITVAVLGLILIQFYWIKNALNIEHKNFNNNVLAAISGAVKNIDQNETVNLLLKTISERTQNDSVKARTVKIMATKNKTIIKNVGKGDSNLFVDVITIRNDTNTGKVTLIRKTSSKNNLLNKTFTLGINKDSLIAQKMKLIEATLSKLILTEKNISVKTRITYGQLDLLLKERFAKHGIDTKYNFAIQQEGKDSLLFLKNHELKSEFLTSHYRVKLFPNDIFPNTNYLLLVFPNKNIFVLKSVWVMLIVSVLLTLLIIVLFYTTVKMLIRQKQITEVKNDLLNNITHQLKTPISSILLATDVINEPEILNNREKTQHYSGIIKSESKRLAEMVENILTAARFEKENLLLNKKEIDIVKTIENVIRQFAMVSNKQNAKINFSVQSGNVRISADEVLIKSALSNLIDNALKYNKNSPKVNIVAAKQNNGTEIIIEDNGIGISKNSLEYIFDTFYRVPTGNIHNTKGNGIGLSITRKIIEAHGGSISVLSSENKGTTFKIFLPKDK